MTIESKLVLHCGANKATREQVVETATPEPCDYHFPIPHSLLLEEVEKGLAADGFEITSATHALTKGGARYFGMIEVRKAVANVGGLDDPSVKPDYGLVVGIRNTHDKSRSAALTMGSHVFICDNLAFSGEVIFGRKHTRNVTRDIPLLMPRAFAALSHELVCLEKRVEAYKGAEIGNAVANDWIVRATVDEQVFPASKIPDVVGQWREPAYEEFRPRTVWSLFNAFTQVAKGRGSLEGLAHRTRGLHGFFDRALGLNLPSREEVLVAGLDDVVTSNDAFDR